MFKRITVLNVVVLGVALASAQFATAEEFKPGTVSGKVFGTQYTPVAPVADRQVQVVYYRASGMGTQQGAAHVYVDREFHTGLLPGGYSAFCVTPGNHSLGAYVKDAPQYKGKSTDVFSANLEGGKTYFLKVREDGFGAPQAIARVDAERELAGMRMQVQALSRASTVQACDYQPISMAQYKDYALSGDVLFAFGKSGYQDITFKGREAIRQLITQLKQENANLDRVEVVGHTDPIGSAASNHLLGLKRAQTVRRMLLDGGLPASSVTASSAGSDQPVSDGCYGSRAEQIACYAADRRVVVRVDTQR
ncbi:OmpA family protein [Pseudomonas chlororaphis]|uniref:OmpA family protein n=1 Tax=Pseudomonas chlororaphis TaxID=587753 RepID=UPI000F5635C4|nr:OmpA family protein [Pseudomonas chlororaphis]AZC83981.1 Outer membrane protein A precursor [Pseudomonas chlororaphis subsp. piscium]